ncbi:Ribulokinase [Rubripirellula lacrimiformis]|uniref:Ribulokinase n=1 Tax=Rubripirellula lacrimiformis TaxID=1930273 RepID=A0A517NEC7_9BACT|nr:ribulokinase [Rubripirellula lacrimiformis]QDT05489.1 Ribulokinase [Rubripirellula lacrimiformis]
MSAVVSLGLDFGTESVRAILVDRDGQQLAIAAVDFAHGQITDTLPGSSDPLPAHFALQAPDDWLDAAAEATRSAMSQSGVRADQIVGVGVDFTSCTMLPTTIDGTPLCQVESLASVPLAWPKLWKHHGAIQQTERMNRIANHRNESFLARYGGTIGLEWFFPKVLETIENAPQVADAAEVWLEAGDWFVWQLVGGPANELTRSSCQAGYKAMWSASEGYPSLDYFAAVHPLLAEVVANRLPGVMRSPGESAGGVCDAMAKRFGLQTGTPVSAAIIDAHSAVPGVGAADPGTLVMVLGTSSCHMLNATEFANVPGVAGVVDGGILPGMFGYETGQAAVGDAFAWLLKLVNLESFESLSEAAMKLPPGADGVACLDWMNGCRTPLMDGGVRGALTGLGLHHGPEHLYLALMEASAFGLRWIVELLRDGGVPIDRFVATGGLPHHNRAFVEVYADVLGAEIEIHPSTQGPAVGAAVLGMLAAGPDASGFRDVTEAASAMASAKSGQSDKVYPRSDRCAAYHQLYSGYRELARKLGPSNGNSAPRETAN